MRLRSSSIRARIIALLLVPIVALVGLWVYATLVSTGDFRAQYNVAATYQALGAPVDQVARDLQAERRVAVERLARPQAQAAQDAYLKAQGVTDADVLTLQSRMGGEQAGRLDSVERSRLREVFAAAAELGALRAQISSESVSWNFALTRYSDLVRPAFAFRSAFVGKQTGQLPREGTILIELARAREYLSQEDAAMAGLQASAAPTAAQYQIVLDPMRNQQALFTVYIAELDPQEQQRYQDLRSTAAWSQLDITEREFQTATEPSEATRVISPARWRQTTTQVLDDLATVNTQLAADLGARATSDAMGQLWRGVIAGLIGLAAVVISVVISLRIGRGMARELIGLRNAAHELSATRLPSVMERLRQGEVVDIAAETPDLEFGEAEIGQVGRAFNAVQRTAVQAAVEQAELRRGVSAVFVNLARRSQVLLHRQLTLLDTMERRTEDPAELEDLFRLDHLTTRMRRHAEGLIILSGGSPGRAWRRPVRMVDVVRAAVGEVEDYARVVVRPFPGTGLLGSAVADVTHLIAELVENAAVFSPPHTQVTIQGEVVAHGFALEIDDRGLGLSDQLLAGINERLEQEQAFDLADTDRLGLFVVSRLARRHGVRVQLRPSPYGGTSAVVLIPRELLAEVPGAEPAPAPAPSPVAPLRQRELVAVAGGASEAPRRRGELKARGTEARAMEARAVESRAVEGKPRGHQRAVTGPQPASSEPASTPGGLPRRRANGGPTLVPTPGAGRHRRPAEQDEPAATTGQLPRRVRQANLAPQLREAAGRNEAAGPDRPVRERSPEEARATFASFQRGFSRGRAEPARSSATAVPPVTSVPPIPSAGPVRSADPDGRRALTSAPVPPALPAAPVPAPPASAEGHDR